MNRKGLVDAVAIKVGDDMTKKTVAEVIDATVAVIGESLARKESVALIGFGTFLSKQRTERNGRNPQTGETIVITAKTVPAFKPGKSLKDLVAG